MGTAIVRRIGAGKKILLGDISEKALERVGEDFRRCGYDVDTLQVNALKKDSVEAFARKAAELGPVMYFIDTAGASPNQANPEHRQVHRPIRPILSTSLTSICCVRAMPWMPLAR